MIRVLRLRTALVTSLAVFLPAVATAQTEETPKRPMIKLSGSADAKAAPDKGTPEKAAPEKAAPTKADPKPPQAAAEKKGGIRVSDQKAPPQDVAPEPDTAEEPQVPETAESAVGVGPSPGLGPAAPAQSKEPPKKKRSEPRVIDTSTKEEKEKVAKKGPDKPPEPKIDPETLPYTYHMRHIDLAVGFRVAGTPSDGLQLFMEEPMFVDTYVRAGGTLQLTDRVALGIGGEFGGGRTSAYIRDLPSQLSKVHMSVGVEGRYHFWNRMYAYGRVAPGVEIVNASVDLIESGDRLSNPEKVGSPAFQVDGALGTAFRFAGSSNGKKRTVRAWAFAEGGYRVSTKHNLELTADEGGPNRTVPLTLDPLNLSGGFFSAGLMLTF